MLLGRRIMPTWGCPGWLYGILSNPVGKYTSSVKLAGSFHIARPLFFHFQNRPRGWRLVAPWSVVRDAEYSGVGATARCRPGKCLDQARVSSLPFRPFQNRRTFARAVRRGASDGAPAVERGH